MESVNWMTLYITGRGNFKAEVIKRLEGSDLDIMPGFMDVGVCGNNYVFYWINEKVAVREVKEALGSKVVFKHRLRFLTSLEQISPNSGALTDGKFSKEDFELIDAMRRAG